MGDQISLFLFAHQDDEFGVFDKILSEQQEGRRIVCAYFTTGVQKGQNPERRNQESLRILFDLGVKASDVHFVGEKLSIADGALIEHLEIASNWIREFWKKSGNTLAAIYVLAWEGGHPDHDGLHAITVDTFASFEQGHLVQQFSVYNNYRCPGPFFRVLSPLIFNGPVKKNQIRLSIRARLLSYCLQYPSQRKTWIGLFPFVAFHYFLRGCQETQGVSVDRINEPPHTGRLYYEKRGFSSWSEVSSRIATWRSAGPSEEVVRSDQASL